MFRTRDDVFCPRATSILILFPHTCMIRFLKEKLLFSKYVGFFFLLIVKSFTLHCVFKKMMNKK